MKKWIVLLILIGSSFGFYALYEEFTGDFRITNITYELPFQQEFEIPSLNAIESNILSKIADQPFYYLDKGNQSYAFVSKDNHYVLKFFRFKHLKPSWVWDWTPNFSYFNQYQKKIQQSQKNRLDRVFKSYKTAYELDQDHTALLFIHLNPSKHLHKKIQVFDKLGFEHTVDLDSTVFLLQQKGQISKTVLGRLLKEGKCTEVKQKIRALLDMYVEEYKRGLHDKDYNLMHNTGFIQDAPFRIDPGRLEYAEEMKIPQVYQTDLKKIASTRIQKWLKKYFPKYLDEIMKDVNAKIEEVSSCD